MEEYGGKQPLPNKVKIKIGKFVCCNCCKKTNKL
jgi:hypothetical protein